MISVQAIEDAIQQLPETDLAELQRWFSEFYGNIWDKKIERDADDRKLNALTAEALAEYHSGLSCIGCPRSRRCGFGSHAAYDRLAS
jgi:hypothetical protein